MNRFSFLAFLFPLFLAAQKTAPIDVTVVNSKGKPYQGDKICFIGQQSKKAISGITNAQGKFHILLPQGDTYDIKIVSIGDEIEYNTLEIDALPEGQFYETNSLQIMYEAATNYTLNNLQFETGKANLKPNSYALLADLVEIMKLKPTMRIEVAGHTDSDGDDAMNLVLSKQRAEAVKNYLVSQGIAAARIVAIGYGESKPIASNATPEGKASNRRTTIQVLN
jgi:OOP family OmpA-OmpF porin